MRKTVCLRRLGGHRRGEERAGRFFANRKVTAAKIVEGWSAQTGTACAGRHVLAIQDTTEVKFPATAQRRRGLGAVKQGNTYGVLVHAMIAVDATTTACLGLVGGEVWTRPGVVTEPHRDRPFVDRESHRWLATVKNSIRTVAPRFSARRMVKEYVDRMYAPALATLRDRDVNKLPGMGD